MTNLATLQSDFLQSLFAKSTALASQFAPNFIANEADKSYARGLNVYRSNAIFLAERSLQASYPVIAQLVGAEAFSMLARDLWLQYPPVRGDVAQWGGGLSHLIASIPALSEEPYLADVARIEWALHQAACASDTVQDLPSLNLLTRHDADAITLRICPSTTLIQSIYPSASIVQCHVYGQPSFAALREKLQRPPTHCAETALVWRQGLRPRVADCSVAERVFLQHLLKGDSLLSALDAAAALDTTYAINSEVVHAVNTSAAAFFEFNTWLPQAAQNGLLLGADLL